MSDILRIGVKRFCSFRLIECLRLQLELRGVRDLLQVVQVLLNVLVGAERTLERPCVHQIMRAREDIILYEVSRHLGDAWQRHLLVGGLRLMIRLAIQCN